MLIGALARALSRHQVRRNSSFQVRRTSLADWSRPRFTVLRERPCGFSRKQLPGVDAKDLVERHRKLMAQESFSRERLALAPDEASILDLKTELARRFIQRCRLCAHRCDVDRTAGQHGVCRLGIEAMVAEHIVHIGEESPINPSLILNLAGCGLRCRYCQQGEILDPSVVQGEPLSARLWADLIGSDARSLSFAGGNPDESLFAILRFLGVSPS